MPLPFCCFVIHEVGESCLVLMNPNESDWRLESCYVTSFIDIISWWQYAYSLCTCIIHKVDEPCLVFNEPVLNQSMLCFHGSSRQEIKYQ